MLVTETNEKNFRKSLANMVEKLNLISKFKILDMIYTKPNADEIKNPIP